MERQFDSWLKSFNYGNIEEYKYNVSSDICEGFSLFGGALICGGTAFDVPAVDIAPDSRVCLLRIDDTGNPVTAWDPNPRKYDVDNDNSCIALGVCRAEDGYYMVTGACRLEQTNPNGFIMKIREQDGDIVSGPVLFDIDEDYDGYGMDVIKSKDGGYVVSGMINDKDEPGGEEISRVFVMKFSSSLSQEWCWVDGFKTPSYIDPQFQESWLYVNSLLEVPDGFDGAGNIIIGYTHNDGKFAKYYMPRGAPGRIACLDGKAGTEILNFGWTAPSDPEPRTYM